MSLYHDVRFSECNLLVINFDVLALRSLGRPFFNVDLPSRISDLPSSRNVDWWFTADVSGESLSATLKG